jgi:phosphoribosylanthranilate isomerase
MRTRVKICCIASPKEAMTAIAAGADALGLVSLMPSGGNVITDAMIAEIAALALPPVATVLLTAETKADATSAHVRATNPTAVQIVAHIEPTESARLARLEPHVRRIQAIHVTGEEALDFVAVYSPHIHAFLLDSGRPGEKIPVLGGTGRTHNWAVSSRFVQESTRPVFLAGGLTAENVGDAIRQVRPFGLDLCSGVRTSGQLDAAKLATFMTAVRRAEWAQTSIRA